METASTRRPTPPSASSSPDMNGEHAPPNTEGTSAAPDAAGAEASPAAAAAPADGKLPRNHFTVIALLLVAAFVVILNETTMGVALPPIMEHFGVSAGVGQWLTTIFMLMMAVVIPMTGFLLQRLGTRGSFLIAMGLFTAGTALAALAPTFGVLVLARVIQACGTAVMLPLLMTTVMNLVPPSRRGRFMGNVSLVIAAAPALGPTMSGALVEPLGWRGVFGVMLPIAAVSLILGALMVKDVSERSRQKLDLPSVPLSALGFGGLVYGLSAMGEGGGAPVHPAIPIGLGAVVLALFTLRQIRLQRTDDALMDMRAFRAPGFSRALAAMSVAALGMFGALILLPLVLQEAMDLDPLSTGLIVLPGAISMGLLGPVVGGWYDRVGPRPLVVPGSVLTVLSMLGLSTVEPDSSWLLVLASHVVLCLGLSMMFTPLFTTALAGLTPALYSHGSAALNTVQQVAGAAGTALFVALFSARSESLAEKGVPAAESLTGGAQLAFLVGAGVLVAGFLIGLTLRRPEGAAPAVTGGH
ncbi:MDR family MFS transporter [Streptomyces fragilis]|uniref:MDR family MFS transporter n=1 Tax=Streptomyces fragilis TaxID=67301 RepID=A0ABV2YEM7_9ACTN|nr:MDR family MFS transporter [Streptomyces fragilis]